MKSIINNTAHWSDNIHCGSLIKCKDMERSNESIYPNILRSKVFNRVSPHPHIFPFISAIKHRLQRRDLVSLEKVSNNELYQYFILFRQSVIGNGPLNCFNTYSIPRFVLKFEGLYWNEHENGAIILYTHLRMLVMFTSHNGKSRTIFLRGALLCS